MLCSVIVIAMAFFSCAAMVYAESPESNKQDKPKPAFSFAKIEYFHRWSKDVQHEFTPTAQEDLNAWTEMVTIWQYPQAKDGDGLATIANTVLEKYKVAKGKVIRTSSVQRTKEKPAEHLIVVVFGTPDFFEAAFARFKMHENAGASIVYSRRFYGKDASEKMRDWIAKNGQATEKSLMNWDEMLKLEGLMQESTKLQR
jgi:hypothetical protein